LFEWIQSPIVYIKDEVFLNRIKHLASEYFILRAGFHHYLSMTKSCFENELQAEKVKVKKYFYALRPILACKWIVDKKEMPPMEFSLLRDLMPEDIQPEVEKLITLKAEGDEKLFMAKNSSINNYLRNTINYCEARGNELPEVHNETGALNDFFRELLQK
jgi:predicted nucleotidyltransferase